MSMCTRYAQLTPHQLTPHRLTQRALIALLMISAHLTPQLCLSLSAAVAQETKESSQDDKEGAQDPQRGAQKIGDTFQLALHPALKIKDLTLKELSLILSGRKRTWQGDAPVQLILLPTGSPEMTWLSKQVKMPEHLIRRFIYRRVYQGTMRPPLEVNSSEEAIKLLQRTPGALAPVYFTPELAQELTPGKSLDGLLSIVTITP